MYFSLTGTSIHSLKLTASAKCCKCTCWPSCSQCLPFIQNVTGDDRPWNGHASGKFCLGIKCAGVSTGQLCVILTIYMFGWRLKNVLVLPVKFVVPSYSKVLLSCFAFSFIYPRRLITYFMQASHVSVIPFVAFVPLTSLTSLIKSCVLGMTSLPSYYPFARGLFSPQIWILRVKKKHCGTKPTRNKEHRMKYAQPHRIVSWNPPLLIGMDKNEWVL